MSAIETPRPRVRTEKRAAPALPRKERDVELSLAIARDGLGIELSRDVKLGPASLTELSIVLPGLKFPLDVSGGVTRFRHRRGALRRLAMTLTPTTLATWASPHLAGIVGTRAPDVRVVLRGDVMTLVVSDASDDATLPKVLAFDVAIEARGAALSFHVIAARAAGLAVPATALALDATTALFGAHAERHGATFVLERICDRAARAVMPEAGARAPSCDGVVVTEIATSGDAIVVRAAEGGAPPAPGEACARAREASDVCHAIDDLLLERAFDRARTAALVALERAPRHAEVCRRIAEIDAHAGNRAEAAIAVLREAARGGALTGTLQGELHVEAGDDAAATAAFVRAGELEPIQELAASAFARAAEMTTSADDALHWLDAAIAHAPRARAFLWLRASRLLDAGRLADALADVQRAEALAKGARAKHAVWVRAGRLWQTKGAVADSAALFERSLRFLPDDEDSLAGLGAALVDEGRAARGAQLLARAIDRARAANRPHAWMSLALARALAERLHDLPAAVARARDVTHDAEEALVARGMEARWRAELGDVTGASMAFARMRDRADTADEASALPWLIEAARFEREIRADLAAAQRHLAVAVRLSPTDPRAIAGYRDVSRAIGGAREEQQKMAPPAHAEEPVRSPETTPEEDEARIGPLTESLRADPTNERVVNELVRILMRLDRGFELLALLSARLDDATPELRVRLLPTQRAVLERLEREAREAGRAGEADLFRDARLAIE